MDRLTLSGNLAVVLKQRGKYPEALALHEENERWLSQRPEDDDYPRNMTAALTNQIDCLTAMGHLEEALRRVDRVEKLIEGNQELRPGDRSRVLAQKGEILADLNRFEEAKESFQRAIAQSADAGVAAILGFQYALAHTYYRNHEDDKALQKLEAIQTTPGYADILEIRSRVLDLRGKILLLRGDRADIECVLESYEIDRQRGDIDGVAVSLVFLAKIYLDQAQLERAEERLLEAEGYILRSELRRLAADAAVLRGRIHLARESKAEAKNYFAMAIELANLSGNLEAARRALAFLREI